MLLSVEGWNMRFAMKHSLVGATGITGELNGWLLAVAIGLGMPDLTVRRQRHAAFALAASCYPR
jgi:hypothetical protein